MIGSRVTRALVVAGLGMCLTATACGSSVDKGVLEAQETRAQPAAAPAAPGGSSVLADGSMPFGGVGTEASASATGSGSPVAAAPGTPTPTAGSSSGGKVSAAPGAGATGAAPASPTASARGQAVGTASGPQAPTPDPGAPRPAVGVVKGDIVLGSVGTESGVIGTATLPLHQAARAWVADVNARGGLAGHKVKLVIADDDGDPNKALALVRRMVEEDKAVAIFGEHGPTTAQAITPYLEQKKVPSIGGCFCAPANGHSPMVFQVGIGGDYGLSWTHILPIVAYTDQRKVSLLFCREAPTCQNMRNRIREFAGSVNVNIVHEAQVSLAQPDFTAEVLAARNAGAEIVVTIMENASVIRIARSAHRQGWNPLIASQGASHDQRFLKEGGSDVEGVIMGAFAPHWESPKLAGYTSALERYVPGGVKSSLGEIVWAAGKLLEVIGAGLPAEPTSADFLRGLYSIKGETLGGLVPPLSYIEGQGSDKNNLCAVPIKVEKGKFVPKDGDNFACPPGWKPVAK